MPKVMSIQDDKHDGYALVTIRVSKDDEIFHKVIEMYRENRIVNIRLE